MPEDDADADAGQSKSGELEGLHALMRDRGRQQDGEEGLRLHHERGEARRDIALDREEEQAELAGADQDAIGGELAPRHIRALQEEDRRQEREGEAQRREEQRREVLDADMDDDEIRAPDHHDGQREQRVAEGERCREGWLHGTGFA